jgi:hypothetical protein
MDVKITFLHSKLGERIYMYQLEGFIPQGKEDYVCLLKKSLYSLKLPPRQWCKRFNTFMLKHGYFMSDYDNFVYFRKLLDGLYVLVIVY